MKDDLLKQYETFSKRNIERTGIRKIPIENINDDHNYDMSKKTTLESFFNKITQENKTQDDITSAINWINIRNTKEIISYEEFVNGYEIFKRLSTSGFNKEYIKKFAKAILTSDVEVTSKYVEDDVARIKSNINDILDELSKNISR